MAQLMERPRTDQPDVAFAAGVPATGGAATRTDGNGEFVVETHGLRKRYGEINAVNGVDLRVRRGEVFGFLGPNGSGKTTTLRMLLGLVTPTGGDVTVLGEQPGAARGLAKIGAMVETPAFYPFLSGRDNLKVLAGHAGVSEARIGPALETVELADRAKDRFGTYSLGMKQRLGVAAALLKDPELLILDEPTNGLDPAGMAEMRSLIRKLGQGPRTVLLSSHMMGEVEQVCDRVSVIRSGEIIAEGTVDELRGQDRLRIVAEPLEAARRIVADLPGIERVIAVNGGLLVQGDTKAAAAINRALVEAEIAVSEVRVERASLEEAFLHLTKESGGQS
jgi:ABC-2 type transport system ATP-binding protein